MTRIIFVLSISWCISFYSIDGVSSKSKYHNYVRCTRRYSPGMCVEPVGAVWTFVFQKQNCTERLGCPVDWRGNRFGNYDKCMHRCLPLVDLYMEILMQDYNASYLRIRKWDRSLELTAGEDNLNLEEEDYEVSMPRVKVEGPASDPADDDDDAEFQDTPDIDYFDDEDGKHEVDYELV